jgi:hypothetical protein
MALIAPFAQVARSTNRSTPYQGITVCQLQNVTADRGLIRQGYGRRASRSHEPGSVIAPEAFNAPACRTAGSHTAVLR